MRTTDRRRIMKVIYTLLVLLFVLNGIVFWYQYNKENVTVVSVPEVKTDTLAVIPSDTLKVIMIKGTTKTE